MLSCLLYVCCFLLLLLLLLLSFSSYVFFPCYVGVHYFFCMLALLYHLYVSCVIHFWCLVLLPPCLLNVRVDMRVFAFLVRALVSIVCLATQFGFWYLFWPLLGSFLSQVMSVIFSWTSGHLRLLSPVAAQEMLELEVAQNLGHFLSRAQANNAPDLWVFRWKAPNLRAFKQKALGFWQRLWGIGLLSEGAPRVGEEAAATSCTEDLGLLS